MDKIVDFIRDFKFTDYGFTVWHVALGFVALVLLVASLKWITSLLKLKSEKQITKAIDVGFQFIVYLSILLFITYAILNKQYFLIFLGILCLISVKNLAEKFFNRYDKLADRLIDKTIK